MTGTRTASPARHTSWLVIAGYAAVAALLATGFAASLIVFTMIWQREAERTVSQYMEGIEDVVRDINRAVDHNLVAVRTLAAVYEVMDEVTREDFRRFARPLVANSEVVRAIVWLPWVPRERRERFEADARRDFPQFKIREWAEELTLTLPAADRDDHLPIRLVEPFGRNDFAIGLDLASDSVRQGVVQHARDTGEITASTPISITTPVGEERVQLLLHPVYRKGVLLASVEERQAHLRGFIATLLPIGEIVQGSLIRRGDRSIQLLSAGGAIEGLQYPPANTTGTPLVEGTNAPPQVSRNIEVVGQEWTLLFAPAPGHYSLSPSWLPWSTLVGGLLVTLLIGAYFKTLLTSYTRTRGLVQALTGEAKRREAANLELERKRDFLTAILDTAAALVVILERDGRILGINRACERLSGYEAAEVQGKPMWDAFLTPSDRPAAKERFRALLTSRMPTEHESVLVTRTGERRFLHWAETVSLGPTGTVEYVIASGIDITERRRQEFARSAQLYMAEAIASSREPEELYRHAATCMRVIYSAGRVRLLHQTRPKEAWLLASESSDSDDLAPAPGTLVISEAAERALETGQPIDWYGAEGGAPGHPPRTALVAVAVRPRFGTAWALEIHHGLGSYGWSEEDRQLLRDLTVRLGEALGAAELWKEVRKGEERLKLALEGTDDGLWDWNVATDELYVSPRWEAMLGYRTGEFRAGFGAWQALVHPDDREHLRRCLRDHLSGRSDHVEAEHRIRTRDGEWIWVLTRGKLVSAPGHAAPTQRVVGTQTNVTDRKRAEQVLREREAAVRQQAEALARADRRKDEFLAMLAHELRNPLAPISNAFHVLRSQGGPLPQAARSMIDIVGRQVGHLTRIVDDLLDVARITQNRIVIKPAPTLVSDVVAAALETVQQLVDTRRHTVEVNLPSAPLEINADRTRLVQVLANLLNNAAKYTPEGGRIGLCVTHEEGNAVIRVQDNGVGIPSELLPHIFDLFAQGEASLDRAQGGLGLGLTLVRRLVELHGGTVEASSEGAGRGSAFTIRLPVIERARHATDKPSPPAGSGRARSCRVLVVEDQPDVAKSFAVLLETMGHRVTIAYDGESGLEMLQREPPAIAFLDIGLPGMSGYELAIRIRKSFPREQLLLVAATGYGAASDRQKALEAGFDQHLAKPVDVTQLQRILAQVSARDAVPAP
jgi:PAS domain S-box-containing protein